mmetsp:Transcript_21337/g.65059  ORF Transcript_21337/g.65059 Transcript_21337/m.65059 type:complete len:244 (-) Transcript_21337:186-917(-)
MRRVRAALRLGPKSPDEVPHSFTAVATSACLERYQLDPLLVRRHRLGPLHPSGLHVLAPNVEVRLVHRREHVLRLLHQLLQREFARVVVELGEAAALFLLHDFAAHANARHVTHARLDVAHVERENVLGGEQVALLPTLQRLVHDAADLRPLRLHLRLLLPRLGLLVEDRCASAALHRRAALVHDLLVLHIHLRRGAIGRQRRLGGAEHRAAKHRRGERAEEAAAARRDAQRTRAAEQQRQQQ